MGLLLLLLFLALPIAEIYVIIQVGQAIGVVPTLFLLILDGIAGAALARSQGRAAWERFNRTLAGGRVPARARATCLVHQRGRPRAAGEARRAAHALGAGAGCDSRGRARGRGRALELGRRRGTAARPQSLTMLQLS